MLALIAAVRVRLLHFSLERDEGEYAYAGQLLLEGIPPYQLAYNMKFPGTYAAYALIMAVFGQTPAGIHLGVTCVTTLTALLLYWLGRRLLDGIAGVGMATTYAVLAASPSLQGLSGHATHFAALFTTAGLCLLWIEMKRPAWSGFAAGAMFGLALLMKQHAVFFCVWGFLFLAALTLRQKQIPLRKRLQIPGSFCLGTALPLAMTCLFLWRMGVLDKFWLWTIRYARDYVSELPLQAALPLFRHSIKAVMWKDGLTWAVAGAGLGLVWLDPRWRGRRWGLAGFALAAFLTVCPGFFFRTHYYLLMLPAVGLLAGCALSAACRLPRGEPREIRPRWWPVSVYALILAVNFLQNAPVWFTLTSVEASRLLYFRNPFVEAEQVAAFIRTNSPADARVAVLGSEPEIYFLSHRRSATGYIYTYPLMEPQPFARHMQLDMIREIESAQPEFVVLVFVKSSWLVQPDSARDLLDWWEQSYQKNYELCRVVPLTETDETGRLLVYKRRTAGEKTQVEH